MTSMIALKSLWPLIKESVSQWSDDYAPSMGAALAYYTIFSIAPLLIIAIAVAGFFFGADAARGEIFSQLRGLIGDDGATAIQGLVKSASSTGTGTFAAIAGIITLLIGATTVFGELQSDLDRILDAPKSSESGI
jgi:membrane protein